MEDLREVILENIGDLRRQQIRMGWTPAYDEANHTPRTFVEDIIMDDVLKAARAAEQGDVLEYRKRLGYVAALCVAGLERAITSGGRS